MKCCVSVIVKNVFLVFFGFVKKSIILRERKTRHVLLLQTDINRERRTEMGGWRERDEVEARDRQKDREKPDFLRKKIKH